jgi:hypothetical protein
MWHKLEILWLQMELQWLTLDYIGCHWQPIETTLVATETPLVATPASFIMIGTHWVVTNMGVPVAKIEGPRVGCTEMSLVITGSMFATGILLVTN